MKHFWLDDDQQAIMDSATSTADDYGYIGLFNIGASWKTKVKEMVGTAVADRDYLRIHPICKRTQFYFEQGSQEIRAKIMAAIRLNKNQAMVMKLRHGGDTTAFVRTDATGECWGNMQIALAGERNYYRNPGNGFGYGVAFSSMCDYLSGQAFGPTLAEVVDHCNGLDLSLATSLVWAHADCWHEAGTIVQAPTTETTWGYLNGEPRRQTLTIIRDLLGGSGARQGKAWASEFYARSGDRAFRAYHNIEPDTGIIIGG